MEGVRLITRSDWGARRPKEVTPLPKSDAKGCAVHYSASSGIPRTHAECYASVRSIQTFHMNTRGWNDIAYNWLFCNHGYVFRGRGLWVRTAAQGTNACNNKYFAACYLGNDTNRVDVTPAGRKALLALLLWLDRQIPGGKMRVRPHSDFTSTSCPGDELRALIKASGWG